MPSRFPGVDPYIEGCGLCPDFHHEFITAWRGALRRSLPKHYRARRSGRASGRLRGTIVEPS
ncbi:MAG TPA: DUF4058 family protein [Pirellulales bacterium]|nr:DUF4058 family protein [Pirellulales bacterium]